MAEWIRVPFGVVSGVGRGIGVLDGVYVPQWEDGVSRVFRSYNFGAWIGIFKPNAQNIQTFILSKLLCGLNPNIAHQ